MEARAMQCMAVEMDSSLIEDSGFAMENSTCVYLSAVIFLGGCCPGFLLCYIASWVEPKLCMLYSQGAGLPAVQEVFHPSTMLAWDMLEKRMKVWFVLSIVNLVVGFFIRYQIYSSILGVIGSSIYLFKSCQGGALGITHSRVNNLTVSEH